VRGFLAVPGMVGLVLSDPALQPKFVNLVPDALAPGFKFTAQNNKFKVAVGPAVQQTGLVDAAGNLLSTPVFGYGLPNLGYTWPGRTFEVQSRVPIEVKWENKLVDPVTGAFLPHLLPVDTPLHWAYSLMGYTQYTIANAGVPIVSHLHGGRSDSQFDGNPEFFFGPGLGVRGPQWVEKKYIYDNSQGAGNLRYHDHALGSTRLNVYAGLTGFYGARDDADTGKPDNPRARLPCTCYGAHSATRFGRCRLADLGDSPFLALEARGPYGPDSQVRADGVAGMRMGDRLLFYLIGTSLSSIQ
jgi:spore coat protein A